MAIGSTTAAPGGGSGDWLGTIANVAGSAYSSYNQLQAAKLQAKAGQAITPVAAAPQQQFTPTVIQLPPQQSAVVAPSPGVGGFGGMDSQTLLILAVAGVAAVMLLK
jgi:uncharacterized membrane protein YebE (DUF533 family)